MKVKGRIRERRAKKRRLLESVAGLTFVGSLVGAVLGRWTLSAVLFATALGTGLWLRATRDDEERADDAAIDVEGSGVSF